MGERGCWRWLAAAVVAAVLPGCSGTRDPVVTMADATKAGEWMIERQHDRIAGAPISSARLTTRTVSTSSIVFAPPAQMQLTCFRGAPIVRFSFEFKIGAASNIALGYRFDEKPGHEVEVRVPQGNSVAVIEDRADVARFAAELATSKSLYILIRALNAGRTSAEFNLEGAAEALQAGFAGCPPQAEPAATAAAGKRKRA